MKVLITLFLVAGALGVTTVVVEEIASFKAHSKGLEKMAEIHNPNKANDLWNLFAKN